MSGFDVIGIGVAVRDITVLLDAFPRPDEKYRAKGFFESSGGPVPTALVTLARLGRRVAFRGMVGDDAIGAFILDDLRGEGVDAEGVVRGPGLPSPSSVILVEEGRRTIFEGWQTDLPLIREQVLPLPACRYLLVDARLPDVQTEAARAIRQAGGRVVLDCGHPRPGVDDILSQTDVAILSHTYPRAVYGDGHDPASFLKELRGKLPADGSRIAGLTLGPEGCAIDCRGSTVWIPGHKVSAMDSTGAGDVFHGAFIHALLANEEPENAARFANAAAALKCRGMTGRAPLPSEKEIRELAGI